MCSFYFYFKRLLQSVGEVVQWLRILVLTENLNLFVAHKSDVLHPLMTPTPGDLTYSSEIPGHLNKSAYVHTDTHRQTDKLF